MENKKIIAKELVSDSQGKVFKVTVHEGKEVSEHIVSLTEDVFIRIGTGKSRSELVEAVFRYLLEREDKEEISGSFDIFDICQNFPDIEKDIGNY